MTEGPERPFVCTQTYTYINCVYYVTHINPSTRMWRVGSKVFIDITLYCERSFIYFSKFTW